MSDLVPVRRALLSVSDKTGLADFATRLNKAFGVELISTGGTAKALRELGLPVTDVAQVTGFPEMMDGRVKTLHPNIHGALLALRDNAEHVAAMKQHGMTPIDLVCVNLYPFKQTIEKLGAGGAFEEAIENIDIGGPSMIRSAAKNHRFVLVVTSPDRYEKVLGDLREHQGHSCGKHRLKQAQRAFAHTAEYDALISKYLESHLAATLASRGSRGSSEERATQASRLNDALELRLTKKQALRYGENPHQQGALYVGQQPSEASVAFAQQLHGKELSYINLLDADGALGTVKEFTDPAACIVKHTTPCGCATAADLPSAFRRAYEGDPLAAFGGIVALNQPIDLATAQAITVVDKLLEVIVAPSYADDALQLLRDRWKNVRLLAVGDRGLGVSPERSRGAAGAANLGRDAQATVEWHMHKIVGGYLVQERDLAGVDQSKWKVASQRQPSEQERRDLAFIWLVCKHVKSNAIAIGRDGQLLGAGAGQMDRVSAARLAIGKASNRAKGAAAASDAFFPFPDGPQLLLDAGVTAIIQPGGAMRDQETIDAVDRAGATMILTGERHFMH